MSVYIIAEGGINHGGSMALAKEMIRQAAACGADAFKTQLYSVEALFGEDGEDPRPEFVEMLKPIELNKDQAFELAEYCDTQGIEFMASVFDRERLGWVEKIGVKCHKIASRTAKLTPDLATEIINIGKPVYVSLGFDAKPIWGAKHDSSISGAFKKSDAVKYLYCVSKYPTQPRDLNMPKDFSLDPVYEGFSDHTLGIGASLMAVARGATVVEKHFTLNKAAQGPDHACSCDPEELRDLVKYVREMEKYYRCRS